MAVEDIPAPVLEGARRVFARAGYERATLDQLAQEAGVNRVTLHRRGWGKEQLLAALTAAAVEEYRAAMWPALTAAGSAAERLDRALTAVCDQAERHKDLLVATGEARDQVFHEEGPEALTRTVFTEPLERIIRDGISEGLIESERNPGEVATLLFNTVGWTYIHLRSGHRWGQKHARAAVVELALRGVLAQ